MKQKSSRKYHQTQFKNITSGIYQVEFTPVMQGCNIRMVQRKKINHAILTKERGEKKKPIISIDADKSFDKIAYSSMIKNFNEP